MARGRREYVKYKEHARALVHERLAYFAPIYGIRFKRVAIRNQKTRWGSCSRNGNLNFNYKIALLPSHLADYIVVHELCHLLEFNHSKRFWTHVERSIQDPHTRRKELRSFSTWRRSMWIGLSI